MTLAEQVKESEVFAELTREERKAILKAIKAGNDAVITEVTAILDQESAIKNLFDRSIEELVEQTVATMRKRLEKFEKKRKTAEKEAAARAQDEARVEEYLDEFITANPTSNKTNNFN